MTRGPRLLLALAPAALACACEDLEFPGTPPPGSCQAGERVCFYEPINHRELVLRCNSGQVDGAIWLIDEVCLDGAICDVDHCVSPGGAP